MSTIIIGAGASGLAAAAEIRRTAPDEQVTIIEKKTRESNTQVAGMRIREGIAGNRQDPLNEILQLFARRNNGEVTPQMELFATTAIQELEYWKNILPFDDDPTWFGPQFGLPNKSGYGRGISVLRYLQDLAKEQGVHFVEGEVQKLHRTGEYVESITYHTADGESYRAAADTVVLASGNIGGSLYNSTNKKIKKSGPELAFEAGFSLTDSTIHMIHPFGNCDEMGNPRVGCFETDVLAGAKVYFLDGNEPRIDLKTTQLLAEHQAHYTFPEIVKHFRAHGSMVGLQFSDGRYEFARVSHHYGHLGIKTTDGISVEGTRNLMAIGDASNLGYWTNHKERFPGFGLLKCFTDARLLANMIKAESSNHELQLYKEGVIHQATKKEGESELRNINTQYLDQWLAAEDRQIKAEIGDRWMLDIAQAEIPTTLGDISLLTAYAHREIGSEREREPLELCREGIVQVKDETKREIYPSYLSRR